MKNINNIEWSEFVLSEIFDITSTQSGIDKNKLINIKGIIPYVTRSDKANGWETFIGQQAPRFKMNNGNCISVGLDTQTVFYQPNRFYTGQNIQVLQNEKLNKYIALFIISLLKQLLNKFSWGSNGATLTRLKRSKIILPITAFKTPDYDFMEQYMRNVEIKIIDSYKRKISERIEKLATDENILPLTDKTWGKFKIGKLFKIEAGKSKGLNHLKQSRTGISYLGATNNNNGVLALVEKVENIVQKGNSIAFIRNGEGSMGYSIYKKEDFIATSDITVGYNEHLNPYVGMFITTIADKIRGKYNFGYKRSDGRLKKETLQLPINETCEPDYKYMEQFMRRIEIDQLTKYLAFISNRR